jgi:hypothetical protein
MRPISFEPGDQTHTFNAMPVELEWKRALGRHK